MASQVATPLRSLVTVTGGGVEAAWARAASARAVWVTSGTGGATVGVGSRGAATLIATGAAASCACTTANVPPAAHVTSATDAAISFGWTAADAFDSSRVCRACLVSRARRAPPVPRPPPPAAATRPPRAPAAAPGPLDSGPACARHQAERRAGEGGRHRDQRQPAEQPLGRDHLGGVGQAPRAVPDVPGQPLAPQRARLAGPTRP